MNRTRIVLLLLLVPVACVAAWAGPAAGPAADSRGGTDPVAVSGSYILNFNVNIGSAVPAGSTISCRAKIAPNLPALENHGTVPVQTAVGVGKVIGASLTGSTANCSVEIPFAWTVVSSQNGVALSYEIDAVSGGRPAAVRTQQGIGAAYPARGAAARLSFNLTI